MYDRSTRFAQCMCYGTYMQARSYVDARKRKGTGCNGARGMRTKYWCRVVRAGEVGSVRARCVVNMYGEFVMLCWGFGERVRERVGCVPWQYPPFKLSFVLK